MKKIYTILLLMTFMHSSFSQAPMSIPYQAVARDNSGNPIANQSILIRFSIYNNSPIGTLVYADIHITTTNEFGLFSLNIGQGTVSGGNFSTIPWSIGTKFLKVEMDPTTTSGFVDMGTQQMLSVPYSLYAGNAAGNIVYAGSTANAIPSVLTDNVNYQFVGGVIATSITAGQKVEVTCSATLGSLIAGGATMNKLSIGQKISSAAFPSDSGLDYVSGYRVAQNTKNPVTLTYIFTTLPAGSYQFGMVYQCAGGQGATWNNNDWGRISVKVINP